MVQYHPDIIVNAAAYTDVDGAEADSAAAFRINAEAVRHLAMAANETRAKLVQVSTDYVFAGDKSSPYVEDDETGPLSIYGKSKLEGEKSAADAHDNLIVRASWLFGDGQNFIRSLLRAAKKGGELEVVNDQIGLPTHALDLANAILDLITSNASGIYHLAGSGQPGSWADLAQIALEAAGVSAKVRGVSTSEYYSRHSRPVANRPRYSVLNCEKAAALGVRLRPWREAVTAYIKEIR